MTGGVPTAIDEAAVWLAANWEAAAQRPLTAVLRERFGLGLQDAVRAMAQAKRVREGRPQ